jgi:hypothetical protein
MNLPRSGGNNWRENDHGEKTQIRFSRRQARRSHPPPKNARKLQSESRRNANSFERSIPKSMGRWWTSSTTGSPTERYT